MIVRLMPKCNNNHPPLLKTLISFTLDVLFRAKRSAVVPFAMMAL